MQQQYPIFSTLIQVHLCLLSKVNFGKDEDFFCPNNSIIIPALIVGHFVQNLFTNTEHVTIAHLQGLLRDPS